MAQPKIEQYRFGRVIVDGQIYAKDLVIEADGVIENWRRVTSHLLAIDDLTEVLEAKPDLLVVGQGSFGKMKVPPETIKHLERAGIEVIAQPTGRACETYNQFREQRHVVAALHLTC